MNIPKGCGYAILSVATVLGWSTAARAQDNASIEARLSALEEQQRKTGSVTAGPGVRLSFYGYAKLDAINDNNYDLGNTTGAMAGVTADSALAGSGSGAHAYESRIGVRGSIDTDWGPLKFNIEGDFMGSGGGTMRLRHAYGEVGPLLAGQTWTNWVPAEGGLGFVQDFNGAAGGSYYRTPQIRYTFRPNDQWRISFAAEEDKAPGTSTRLAFSGFAGYSGEKLKVGLGAIFRGIDTENFGTVNGHGLAFGAEYDAWQGGKLRLQFITGKAITTSLANSGYSGVDAAMPGTKFAFDVGTDGRAVKANAIKVGFTQEITEKSDFSVGYGMQRYDRYAGAAAIYTKQLSSTYLTYRYNVNKSLMLAGEVAYLEREQFDSTKLDNTRIQSVVKFSF